MIKISHLNGADSSDWCILVFMSTFVALYLLYASSDLTTTGLPIVSFAGYNAYTLLHWFQVTC